ncbi:hypothetical protein [Streptomyces sp. NPDC021212]|uniref:hypothetical protein n=1 Tax=Streptomyces sp. NPDC021212 TaxID=3365118 RepID=UPI00379CE553
MSETVLRCTVPGFAPQQQELDALADAVASMRQTLSSLNLAASAELHANAHGLTTAAYNLWLALSDNEEVAELGVVWMQDYLRLTERLRKSLQEPEVTNGSSG